MPRNLERKKERGKEWYLANRDVVLARSRRRNEEVRGGINQAILARHQNIKAANHRGETHVYLCEHCSGWHVGSASLKRHGTRFDR